MSAAHRPDPPAVAEPGQPIRAKWAMDGATTLLEAAERLEAHARWLRELHDHGWTLTGPVVDDYGTLVSPDGNSGPDDVEDA